MPRKLRRYRVVGITKYGNFKRVHTLSAYNMKEAGKLILSQYSPKGKVKVTCLK